MTSAKYFDTFFLVVTRSHSWSLVVTRGLLVVTRGLLVVIRGHSWSLVCTFRHDLGSRAESRIELFYAVNIPCNGIKIVARDKLQKQVQKVESNCFMH